MSHTVPEHKSLRPPPTATPSRGRRLRRPHTRPMEPVLSKRSSSSARRSPTSSPARTSHRSRPLAAPCRRCAAPPAAAAGQGVVAHAARERERADALGGGGPGGPAEAALPRSSRATSSRPSGAAGTGGGGGGAAAEHPPRRRRAAVGTPRTFGGRRRAAADCGAAAGRGRPPASPVTAFSVRWTRTVRVYRQRGIPPRAAPAGRRGHPRPHAAHPVTTPEGCLTPGGARESPAPRHALCHGHRPTTAVAIRSVRPSSFHMACC